ncbi:unnamed protein product [Brassica rapa subsp. trilocularis]
MKRNFWLVALFLVLSFVISSYAASTHPYHNRKLVGEISCSRACHSGSIRGGGGHY